MDKPAAAEFPIHDLVAKRWSPRAFSDRPVDAISLRSLLEAARWAPSCNNGQPWAFLVASKQDSEAFAKMLACLVEGNQIWARHAPVLMISVASLNWARDGKPNRHAPHDTGMASSMLAIQATSMELATHFMAGFSVDKARETYNIPLDCEPMAAIAVGYPGDPSTLPEELRKREIAPRTRKPQSDFVFSGAWGAAMK
jgi:nitroreductase